MHARVLETMKDKLSALKLRFRRIPHRLGAVSNPRFSHYKKSYMVPFQNTKNPKGKFKIHRNSGSKREFF